MATATLEDILAAVQHLQATVDGIKAAQASAPSAAPATTPAGDLLPGQVTIPVPAPDSHVRYRVALDAVGKSVQLVVGEAGEQGFTWTYNEADPSGRSASIGMRLMNQQGAVALEMGQGSMPGTSSFATITSQAPAWQPRVAPGVYELVLWSNVPTMIDFEFH